MRARAERSLEEATSCIAFVICIVLLTLLMRRRMSFIDAPAIAYASTGAFARIKSAV